MGILRSMSDHSELIVRDVILGFGARDMDENGDPFGEYRWEHPRIPNGVIDDSGTITLDEAEDV
jgi:hypothetical protein